LSDVTEGQFKKQYGIKKPLLKLSLCVLLIVTAIIALIIGKYTVDPQTVFSIIISKITPIPVTWTPSDETIVLSIRLVRTISVILVGVALASSGAAFQATFRNPLVSEHILGTATAAGFGAALALLLNCSLVMVELFAFIFGFIGVFAVIITSKRFHSNQTLILVLIGVIIAALFSSLTSLVKFLADPYDKLPSIVYWLMGSFTRVNTQDVLFSLPLILFGVLGLYLLAWRMNILSMGEEEARSMGINTNRLRLTIILLATLITSVAVSICGIIGWIGLIIPHIARMLFGPNNRVIIPFSCIIGAAYLLVVDTISRMTGEVPIGIYTSIIGLPVFLYLLKEAKRVWV
jgi:iron complex transport system permease protein